jgi:hypothetical protein
MDQQAKKSSATIKCPKCGALIPVTETLHDQLAEQVRDELRKESDKQKKTLAAKETELNAKEKKIQQSAEKLEQTVQERLASEKAGLTKAALTKARGEVSVQIKDLQAANSEMDRKLLEAQEKELQLRKEKRDLEAAKKAFELETARTLDNERQKIREGAVKEVLEEHRMKDAEKERKLQEALKVNEELKLKLQQGSQQTQGEVLELELEQVLKANCPLDEILPVPKGVTGADVLQKVRNRTGLPCGLIIWETKRTKNWSDGWIPKLKEDQRQARADIAVLVTETLPKDVNDFGYKDGVWIAAPRFVLSLLTALRWILTEVALVKVAAAGKNETVEALFNYMTGPEFRHRVEAIVGGFSAMKQELDEEKRITSRRWAKREKQLDLIISNTSGMYGDLQGLTGTSLQPILALEGGDSDGEHEFPSTASNQDESKGDTSR